QVDLKGKGNIGAVQAANFLKKSELKESILSDIWDLADPQGRGFLDKQGFYVALKLIAVVQSGREVDAKYLTLDLPPPSFPNTTKPTISNVITNNTSKITSLTERLKYDQIFDTLNPVEGLIPGNKVKPILLNSKLPVDVLGQVWDLSDIDGDGSLDREEFSVAMNLVYKALQKIPVPSALPPEMVPPNKRKQKIVPSSNPTTVTTKILSLPPDKADKNAVQPSTSCLSSSGNSQPPHTVGWVVTPQAKAQCDELFVKADTDKDGYVSGSEIKRIFIKSGLPQPVLAKIWSLCDTKNQGKLNKDQFALAMHLIQQKLKGVDVPNKLAQNMIPPSARRNSLGDNVPPPGTVYDMNTPGIKEIELLTADIEKIKIAKQKSDAEKLALNETIKSFESDFISLQQEIDVVVEAVKQLNNQKNEAQKRLDELDNKVCFFFDSSWTFFPLQVL
ncbi:hypothetical protein HELRODRAFT_64374, partial [Helobdella robusta]|uniref:Epidermal growth factor receptor substrate 15-like 1 n=1 Tax=Helobdella robusta TaxID=6412 RepID=T1FXT8_HELRO